MERKRQKRILELLDEHQGWITNRQLAVLLNVSDRTIRSDIRQINQENSRPLIESDVQKGYRLLNAGNKRKTAGADTGQWKTAKGEEETKIPQTAEARCIYIIQKLLFGVQELNILKLQEQIYVSSYTIERDLKRIREMLKPYTNLKLVRNGKCISLQGDELSKRKFYRTLLIVEIQKNFLNLNQLASLYKEFNLMEVRDMFLKVAEEYNYPIHDSMQLMLIIHAATSIERMIHSNYINMEESDANMKDTIEYQISKDFFKRVSDRLHFEVRESERHRFAIVIMGRRASNYTSDFIQFRGKWINTEALAQDAIQQIYTMFGIDFREDGDLSAGLKLHLYGMIEREKNQVDVDDVFLEEIQKNYPLVFEMGIYVAEYLGQRLGFAISGSEIAFIALHLGAASERLNGKRRYRAVIILPYNQTFSNICITKLSEMFQERMEVVGSFYYFEEEKVAKLEPDLILTAFPVSHCLDIPTVPIKLFVDFGTESNVLKALNLLDQRAFQLELIANIRKLIRKEHYYENLEFETPEEVIRFLCRDLEEHGAVNPDFCDVVLRREAMSPTSFVNTFATPHALGSSAKISTIAVAQLKHPVRWGNFEVKLVMLFAVKEEDHHIIKIFFDWVSSLMNDMERLADLSEPCGYETFLERIME